MAWKVNGKLNINNVKNEEEEITEAGDLVVDGDTTISGKLEVTGTINGENLSDKINKIGGTAYHIDFNTLTDSGAYSCGDTGNAPNSPGNVGYGMLYIMHAEEYILQRFIPIGSLMGYYRSSVDNGETWTVWHKDFSWKDITVTTTTNSGVSPFSCFGYADTGIEMGKIISVTPHDNTYTNPCIATLVANGSNGRIRVYSKTAEDIKVRFWYRDDTAYT